MSVVNFIHLGGGGAVLSNRFVVQGCCSRFGLVMCGGGSQVLSKPVLLCRGAADGAVRDEAAVLRHCRRVSTGLVHKKNAEGGQNTNRRLLTRARIFLTFKKPRNRFQGINSASLAGRYYNPIPTRFLAPIECLKIPAQ